MTGGYGRTRPPGGDRRIGEIGTFDPGPPMVRTRTLAGMSAPPSGAPYQGTLVEDGLELLSEHECFELARHRPVGRVAVCIGALPAVFPVNYCLVDRDVVFRTSVGTKLEAATREAVVAFEIDDFDTEGHLGWSVLIVGVASEVGPEDLTALEPLPVRAWAHGERDHVVRIRTEFISGRRILSGRLPA
jgi:nitroimidazol reductase NimA-like FMN-containing flavoprotein (pyridoxamine 5'-phosphate oxidase superfamily)